MRDRTYFVILLIMTVIVGLQAFATIDWQGENANVETAIDQAAMETDIELGLIQDTTDNTGTMPMIDMDAPVASSDYFKPNWTISSENMADIQFLEPAENEVQAYIDAETGCLVITDPDLCVRRDYEQ